MGAATGDGVEGTIEGTMALAFIAILIHSQAASIPSAQGWSNYP